MISFQNVSFSYDQNENVNPSVKDVNLTIEPGQFVVLCGKSGCGKTTLTRCINGLIPHYYEGKLTGSVLIGDHNVSDQPLAKTSRMVGSVFQNPRSQFFNVDTTSEIAFGCENLGMPVQDIIERLENVSEAFVLRHLLARSIFELSGGEKQRIACASVYAVQPDIFVLDEPSSNLDPASVQHLAKILAQLKSEGKTIIVSEHRLHYLSDLADRFIYMEQGEIVGDYTARQFAGKNLYKIGLRPLTLNKISSKPNEEWEERKLFEVENLHCKLGKKEILCIDSLRIPEGEIVAIIGSNGAGKSIFAGCFCGITKHTGKITYGGVMLKPRQRLTRSYMVMQDVNHQLFTESVLDEITLNIPEERLQYTDEVLSDMGIAQFSDCHPLALSGGQKQRVAIAGALTSGKELLIYDEPTSGLDYESMENTCSLIRRAAKAAELSLVITHDLEFIMQCCTSVLHIDNGEIKDYYPLNTGGIDKTKRIFMKRRSFP